ncbi:PKD domain-containing protein [Candidatus Peribacteria bacterium]|nr:PKD domain-containing protein [Candidatus Peribacteria bacterium]
MNPIMELYASSDFAPVTLTVDASASNVRSGRIAKYLFDFGENKPPVDESKAVQTYIYDRPGEYSVVLTIVKDDGTKASIKRTIIVNTPPKNLSISRSLSSAPPEQSIDFNLSTVSNNIASYYWEFGDDISSQEEAPSHSYKKTGEYNVLLRVRYVDGTTATASTNVKIE